MKTDVNLTHHDKHQIKPREAVAARFAEIARASTVPPWLFLLLALICFVTGCGTGKKENPSFKLDVSEAKAAMGEMFKERRTLSRPVVVLGGWLDGDTEAAYMAEHLQSAVSNPQWVIPVFYEDADSFEACRERVIAAVDEAFNNELATGYTIEVDVVAYSMGGLVARFAAQRLNRKPNHRILKMNRLFTISTPHRGAALATLPTVSRLQTDMRANSEFIQQMDERAPRDRFLIYPYVRLGDIFVGPENAAPPRQNPWWVTNRAFEDAHMAAYTDPRLLADIARRLRNEVPYSRNPAAPVPGDNGDDDE